MGACQVLFIFFLNSGIIYDFLVFGSYFGIFVCALIETEIVDFVIYGKIIHIAEIDGSLPSVFCQSAKRTKLLLKKYQYYVNKLLTIFDKNLIIYKYILYNAPQAGHF